METKYKLLKDLPHVYAGTTFYMDDAGLYYNEVGFGKKYVYREWANNVDWFEEVKPTRIELKATVHPGIDGNFFYFFGINESGWFKPSQLDNNQHQRVEAAVNGELFTKEDVVEFAEYYAEFDRDFYAKDMIDKWIQSRTHAR